MLNDFRIQQWKKEAVVYHLSTGNMYLLPSNYADLLVAIDINPDLSLLIKRVKADFQLDTIEADHFLNDLYAEYRTMNLIS